MQKVADENALAKVLYIGAAFVTLFVTTSTSDPVNVTKLVAVSAVAFSALGMMLRGQHSLLWREHRLVAIAVLGLLLTGILSMVMSKAPLTQNFYGQSGRQTGFLTYLSLSIVFLAATTFRQYRNVRNVIWALLVAGGINILYCAVALWGKDPIPWSNPYKTILGTFGNPDFISAFLGLAITAALALAFRKGESLAFRASVVPAFILGLYEIKRSHAIQGLVVTAFGLAVLGFFLIRAWTKGKTWVGIYSLLVAGVGLLALGGALQKGPLAQYIYKTSVSLRGAYWHAGLQMAKDHPLFGVGFDTYGDWYRQERSLRAATVQPGPGVITNVAHNVYIDALATNGIFYFAFYVALVLLVLRSAVKIFRRSREFDATFVALLIAWAGYQLQSIVSINQIGLAVWGWILGGALIAYEKIAAQSEGASVALKATGKKMRGAQGSTSSAAVAVLGIVGFIIGLLIALPPYVGDAKWQSAVKAGKLEAAVSAINSWPLDSERAARASQLFYSNKQEDIALELARKIVKANPNYFDGYTLITFSTKITPEERAAAEAQMDRLDPYRKIYLKNNMKVSIIGQGYVGLTIAVAGAGQGHEVTGFDMNSDLVARLNTGNSHIEGVESSLLAGLIKSGKYRATSGASDIRGAEVVVIAVPTPLDKERKPDLAFVESACKSIGENLDSAALIINESTSFPGTVRNLIAPTIEKYSKKKLDHLFAVSPERVDPGNEKFNQSNTPRLYAGLTPEASAKVREFYSSFCANMVEVSSPEVAEAAKLFENTFRQVNIALVNEFAQITNALGISVHETLDAAATKPYGFMKFNPSAGVGGHCIPVDPSYLAYVSAGLGVPATFIERANEVNLEMPKYVVARVIGDIGALKGKNVLVVGVAYKPNVADTRETPAELVIAQLKAEGAIVAWHDDVVGQWHGEKSAPLKGNYDAAIVVTLHKSVNVADVKESAAYVFDTTGKVPGVKGL